MSESAAKNQLRLIGNTARAAVANRRLDRRALVAGSAVAGAAVIGVAGAAMLRDDAPDQPQQSAAQTGQTKRTNAVQQSPSTPEAASTPPPEFVAGDLPEGFALVTSPRLPLWGVGKEQASALAKGAVRDWSEVGAPLDLPVRTVALEGFVAEGLEPAEVYPDYEALVAGLDEERGSVALIPVEQIDYFVNTLSVDGIDPLPRAGSEDEPVWRMAIVGDMIPGRNTNIHIRRYEDPIFPFRKVSEFLKSFDVTVGNWEIIVSDTIPPPEDEDPEALDFVCSSAVLEGLNQASFDAVSLANNHSVYNTRYGIDAFFGTIGHLDDAGIPYFGAGRNLDEARAAWTKEVGGRSIAFIGIDGVTANVANWDDSEVVDVDVGATADTPGTNPFILDQFTADVEALAAEHDIVIPFFHMGRQYQGVPPPWAIEAAHASIDAGAALVVSSHPHIIQGMEIYQGRPIVYGLGNFIYDQMFSVETRTGEVLALTFKGDRLIGLRVHGVEIEDFTQPRLMGTGEQAAFMTRFWRSFDRIAGRA